MWAAEVHDRKTLQQFRAPRSVSSADTAEWIAACPLDACENATLCLAPCHVVRWATDAPDVARRSVWTSLRQTGVLGEAASMKHCRDAPPRMPSTLRLWGLVDPPVQNRQG